MRELDGENANEPRVRTIMLLPAAIYFLSIFDLLTKLEWEN